MQPVVAVIAPGMMGSAVGRRLVENGLEVRTSLTGRSDATVARAKATPVSFACVLSVSSPVTKIAPPVPAVVASRAFESVPLVPYQAGLVACATCSSVAIKGATAATNRASHFRFSGLNGALINVSSSLPMVITPCPSSSPNELDWTAGELAGASGSAPDNAGFRKPVRDDSGCWAVAVTANARVTARNQLA